MSTSVRTQLRVVLQLTELVSVIAPASGSVIGSFPLRALTNNALCADCAPVSGDDPLGFIVDRCLY